MPKVTQNGNALVITLVLVVLALAGFIAYQNKDTLLPKANQRLPSRSNNSTSEPSSNPTAASNSFQFSNPKKSAHYESNTPEHGSTLVGVPINIVINFNFDLALPSSISITRDDKEYATADTKIDTNKLAMRRSMESDAPDGLYTVNYNACWPDKSCHDGMFQFVIDRSKASSFKDMTAFNEVKILMADIAFEPQNIKIKKGTRVMWMNNDIVEHYVNTDSHPAHTYYPAQNSKALAKGDTYSLTFDTPGIYPYHCSAHEANMMGSILVE